MKRLLDKKNLVILLILLVTTAILNGLVFSNQLNYGFRDVDWQVLYYFKLYGNLSIEHLLQEIKVLGVYVSESYYVGLLETIFGLNFEKLHLATQIFKITSALAIYFLILRIFKRKLLAFITSLFYTISYTHAGALFQLSSGGYFLTTIFMVLFLILYYYSLVKKSIIKISIASGILLLAALLLKPERMYPLIALVITVEIFISVMNKFKKDALKVFLKRVLFIFLPLVIFYLIYHFFIKEVVAGFAPSQFWLGVDIRMDSMMKGNLQLLLYPFASFGSIFLFEGYWKLLGQLNFEDIGSYTFSLITGPVLRLGIVTFVILSFIYKKPLKLTAIVMALIFIFGLKIYALNINWQYLDSTLRIHFDPNLIAIPAIFGGFVLLLGGIFLTKWIREQDLKFAPPAIGSFFAFLFILLTWLPSDIQLVFMGPQRYLSIPSIGVGLFISGLLVVIFDRLKGIKPVKNFAWMIFLILIPLIYINYQVATKFFNYEFTYAGLRGTEQTRMKNKFRQIVGEINRQDKSLFYFDESLDKENGYFDEGTTIAGFEYWIRVNMDGSLNHFPTPGIIRTNHQCPKPTHKSCISFLRASLAVEDGERGIWYSDPIRGNINHFYPLVNIYAVRFVNKDIVDIKQEVLEELNTP